MSESYFLESKAKGVWEYEVEENKTKVKYPIKLGFNEIPESHRKTLEDDPGYKAKIIKGIYKEMKPKDAKAAEKKDVKSINAAKELSEAKKLYETKVTELKEGLKADLKKEKLENQTKNQQLVDLRGEALQKVKALEREKITLSGEFAGVKANLEKELKIAKDELDGFATESSKELNALKISSEKKIKALEGVNKALEGQVKNLKAK